MDSYWPDGWWEIAWWPGWWPLSISGGIYLTLAAARGARGTLTLPAL